MLFIFVWYFLKAFGRCVCQFVTDFEMQECFLATDVGASRVPRALCRPSSESTFFQDKAPQKTICRPHRNWQDGCGPAAALEGL